MSLPQKLLYNNKINSSYARNFNSVIQAQNTSNYTLGQTAIFNIPCMRNQVLSGADTMLSMKFKIRNGGTADNSTFLNKGGIASCIQRLRIFSGSQLLCDIDNYGNLISLLTPWQSSSEHVVGKLQVLQGCGSLRGVQVLPDVFAVNTDGPEFDFCFPLMSILSLTDNLNLNRADLLVFFDEYFADNATNITVDFIKINQANLRQRLRIL